jgi:hypothetical protein
MALTITFIGPKSGDKCELFHGEPYTARELRGHIEPLQTVTLDASLTANFSANPGNGYALRLRNASGRVYARSNTRSLASKRNVVALELLPQLFPEAEFGGFAPDVPFKDGKTTFDKLALDYVGSDMRLFGHALHDGVINKRFTFDYRFRMDPVDIPVWTPVNELPADETPEDTFLLDTTSLNLDADRAVGEPLMAILKPIIRSKFRKSIQRRFHEALLEKTAGNKLNPVVTVTSATVVNAKKLEVGVGVFADTLG